MMNDFIPIERYATKFYQKENSSKRFLDLSEEQLVELSKRVYSAQEAFATTISNRKEKSTPLDKYQKTLQFLTNTNIYFDLRTFDERMAYLIMMVDPNLVTFKEFLKLDLISATEIDKVEDKKEREFLKQRREQSITRYESVVRDKIGFFDVKLLKHEELFFKRFFNEKELITEVGINNQDKLMNRARLLKDFSSISDERYEELGDVAQAWLSLVPEKYNVKVAAYNITNQRELLGLKTLPEQLVLFILLIDSDLDMLKIYEEESLMKNIEQRAIERFGFFNKELIVLEKKFHDRFYPNKDLTFWSKVKRPQED